MEQQLWIFWDILVCAIESILIIYVCNNQLTVKKNSYLVLGALYLFIVLILTTLFVTNYYIRMLINFFASMLFSFLAFTNTISHKIIMPFVPLVIANGAESIAVNMLASLNVNMEAIMEPSVVRFQVMLLILMISLVMYYIAANASFFKSMKKETLYIPLAIKVFIFILFILACFAIQTIIDFTMWLNQNVNDQSFLISTIFISGIIIIFAFSFLILIIWLGLLNQKNIQHVKETDRIKNQLESIKNAEAMAEALSFQRHDMKSHLETMAALINDNKIKELKDFFKNYAEQLDAAMQILFTGIPPLDASLAIRKSRAAANKIAFQVICKPNINFPIEIIEVCSLIGNMLDNALEASMKVSDNRYVVLKIIEYKDHVIISVENSADNITKIVPGQTEKASEEHGLGIRQMHKLTEKAGGFLSIDPLGSKVIVTAVLPVEKGAMA